MAEAAVIVLSCVVITIVAFAAAHRNRRRELYRSLDSLANRRRGTRLRQDTEGSPVSFVVDRTTVEVSLERRRRRRWLAIRFVDGFPSDARVEIRNRRLLRGGPRAGDRRFRREYVVRGEPAETVREMITPGVQAKVRHLRTEVEHRPLSICIEDGAMVVMTRFTPVNGAILDRVVEAATPVFEELAGVMAAGIEMDEPSVTSASAHCRICGESLVENIVFCRKCNTPHHKDCWKFNGACSMFACGEKRFTKRAPARPGVNA